MIRVLGAFIFLFSGVSMAAPQSVTIHTGAGRVSAGATVSELRAYAGSNIEIRWITDTDGSVMLTAFQTSSSRKIKRDESEVVIKDGEGVWSWSIPESRGIAHYRIELATEPPTILNIIAYDPEAHDKLWQTLSKGAVEISGYPSSTIQALRALGLRPKAKAASSEDASLSIQTPGQPPRQIRFHERDPHQTVWIANSGEYGIEWKIFAPRSWLNHETLATDDGKIRLLTLLTEGPKSATLP